MKRGRRAYSLEGGQHGDTPSICTCDLELCKLQTEPDDRRVDVTLGDGRWFRGAEVGEDA